MYILCCEIYTAANRAFYNILRYEYCMYILLIYYTWAFKEKKYIIMGKMLVHIVYSLHKFKFYDFIFDTR